MNEVKLLIGGRDCDAADKATFERLNPVTGEVASRAAAATLADADAACEAAAAAVSRLGRHGPGRAPQAAAEGGRPARRPGARVHRLRRRRGRQRSDVVRLQRHAGGQHAARSGVDDDADRRRGHPLRRARA